jgi:hypothetical protein
MKLKDALVRDPSTHPLVNQGQARVFEKEDQTATLVLRGELETFVCEGQYAEGIHKVVESFLQNQGRASQKGAWISGFYGSGKSHLLKMLCHLWKDTPFKEDGASARSLVPDLPDELRNVLRELDVAARRFGGLVAAAGALPGGTTDHVRLTILSVLLRGVGLPDQYPQARFCLWLHSQGILEKVKAKVAAAGANWEKELNNLYVTPRIAGAVIECEKGFASDVAGAKQLIRAQFPPQQTDITTQEFLSIAKDALHFAGRDGKMPCTLLILDEVQQYIGDSKDRSVLISEVAEAMQHQMDGMVQIVAAGQNALSGTELLTRLQARFTLTVQLSDTDVEAVTRKVLLQKKPNATAKLKELLEKHDGEVARQLQGTRIGKSSEDARTIVDDYPLLPVRRRFWEHCFRQIDAAGTKSALRSQLQIIHQAIAKIADKPLGTLIPADELYYELSSEMISTGVLLREISEKISKIKGEVSPLAQRVCAVVFLIGKLKHEGGADIGVRATKDHISDLLIDNLTVDNGKFRSEVEVTLSKLAEMGTLLLVGDEYRLQTREGSEWDSDFKGRQAKLKNDDAAIQFKRETHLYAEVDKAIRGVRLLQGTAKVARSITTSRGDTPPEADGDAIPLWLRDAWSAEEKDVVSAARAAGNDSAVIFSFIPRKSADELKRAIVDFEAAQQTLDSRGIPSTSEGTDARQGMESRRQRAAADRDRLIAEIVKGTKIFQGGGNEVMGLELADKIRQAGDDAMIRLFPHFKDADSPAWEAVIKRAREGAADPFQPVGHVGDAEKHPVCQQVVATIGSGAKGSEIRKSLTVSPYGWPQDAIDAALIALHRLQHVSATLNGQAVPLGQLDQNKIAKTEFRSEQSRLSVTDRLALRKLFQAVGVECKSNEEALRAPDFINALLALARSAGGDAPLPLAPTTTDIEDVQRKSGNDQLAAIKDKAQDWTAKITTWIATRDAISQRRPVWEIVEKLSRQAAALPAAAPHLEQVNAIREHRQLLEGSNPAGTVRVALAGVLRTELQKALAAHDAAFATAMKSLGENAQWAKLKTEDQSGILAGLGLVAATKPDVSNDEALASALDAKPLSVIQSETDAISGRVNLAIEKAAKLLEPTVQTIALERTTLRTEADVDAWLDRQKEKLTEAVRVGPVLVK